MHHSAAFALETDESRKNGSTSTLVSRNVTIHGKRTSMRLEPAMWDALIEISRREKLSLHQICTMVADYKGPDTSFTAAVRVFAMTYFRAATTEEGHRKAGHGSAFLFSKDKDFGPFLRENGQDAYRASP